VSAAHGELAPEHLSTLACDRGRRQTTPNEVLKVVVFPSSAASTATSSGQLELTPMHARTARVTHTAHESSVNILCRGNTGAHYILWLAPLTTCCEFYLYYDI